MAVLEASELVALGPTDEQLERVIMERLARPIRARAAVAVAQLPTRVERAALVEVVK